MYLVSAILCLACACVFLVRYFCNLSNIGDRVRNISWQTQTLTLTLTYTRPPRFDGFARSSRQLLHQSYTEYGRAFPIRYLNRFDSLCESIRFVKKSAFRFTSCHAFFLAYLLYSYNSYAMHTIRITPNLLSEYQYTSDKFIRLPNRIESNRKNRFGSENRMASNRNFFARIGMLCTERKCAETLYDTIFFS